MREIKFRAWDGRQMEEVDGINLYLTNEGLFELWCGSFAMSDTFEKEKRDYPVMQYTGLKDKNGKEIYEGDVVAKSFPLFQPLGRGQRVDEVVWGRDDKNTGMWELRLISDDRIKRNPENKVPYFEPFGLGCEPHNFEIIGNIYESPELINPND